MPGAFEMRVRVPNVLVPLNRGRKFQARTDFREVFEYGDVVGLYTPSRKIVIPYRENIPPPLHRVHTRLFRIAVDQVATPPT
jgi:hypothetical protein